MLRKSSANQPPKSIHLQDSDCTVDTVTGLCVGCGVLHGAPCYHCGAAAYHRPGCINLVRARSSRVLNLQRDAAESIRTAPNRRPNLKNVQFVAVDRSIMRGAEHIATAVSRTMATRIARALNLHKPNSRGF